MKRFKGLLCLVCTLALLLVGLQSTHAGNYREKSRDHLADKLSVNPEIIVVDGRLQVLSYLKEELWVGRYHLEGEKSEEGERSEPDRRVEDEASGSGEDAGTMPDYGEKEEDMVAFREVGQVIYRVSTGEFLDEEEANFLFEEERRLHQEEWERLSKEAGIIAVELYMEVAEAPPEGEFEVMLWPRFQETEEMRRELEKIREEYGELHLPGMRLPGEVSDTPDGPAKSREEGEVGILPMPEPDEAVHDDAVQPEDRLSDEEAELYREVQEQLQEVYLKGYHENIERVEAALQDMGVTYDREENSPALTATMTAEQILSLIDAPYLQSISKERYAAIDLAVEMQETAEEDMGRVATAPPEEGGGNYYFWLFSGLGLLFIVGAGLVISRYRKVN